VYGQTVSEEEKEKSREIIQAKYSDIEFYEIDGGQEVYDYILIIE
jgi:dihydroxyacetone kinase-like predicted kinase